VELTPALGGGTGKYGSSSNTGEYFITHIIIAHYDHHA
jgi:hypothetical protein